MAHLNNGGPVGLTNSPYTSARCELVIVQSPADTRALSNNQRARGHKWPLEPPPVIELSNPDVDSSKWLYIHNPNLFCVAELLSNNLNKPQKKNDKQKEVQRDNLHGQLASSLHKIKRPDERNDYDSHCLKCVTSMSRFHPNRSRANVQSNTTNDQQVYAAKINSITSSPFTVHGNRAMVQTKESTALSRLLSESGIKIRLRKESTKRKPYAVDWSSRSHDAMATSGPQNMLPPIYHPNRDIVPPQEMGLLSTRNMALPQVLSGRMAKILGEDVSSRLHVEQRPLDSPQYPTQEQRLLSSPQYPAQEQHNQNYHQHQQPQQQHPQRHPQQYPQQYSQQYPQQYPQQHQRQQQQLQQLQQSTNGANLYHNQASSIGPAQIRQAYEYWHNSHPGTGATGSLSMVDNSGIAGGVVVGGGVGGLEGGMVGGGDWRPPTTTGYQAPTPFSGIADQRVMPTSSGAVAVSLPAPSLATAPAPGSSSEPDPDVAPAPAPEDPSTEDDPDAYRNTNGYYGGWRGPTSWE